MLPRLGDFLNTLCNFGRKSKCKYQQPRHTYYFLQLVWKVIESNTANEKCWVKGHSRKPTDYPDHSSSRRIYTQNFSQGLLKWSLSPLVQLWTVWLITAAIAPPWAGLHCASATPRSGNVLENLSQIDSGLVITSHFHCCKLWGLLSCGLSDLDNHQIPALPSPPAAVTGG